MIRYYRRNGNHILNVALTPKNRSNETAMRENEMCARSTGVWIRTNPETVNKWRKQIKETLRVHGYRLLGSTALKDSHHMSFYHDDFERFPSLVVNSFKTGDIEMKTKTVDFLLETVVPQLEERLEIKLQWGIGDEEPSAVECLGRGEEFADAVGHCMGMKPWLPPRERRMEGDDVMMDEYSDISSLDGKEIARTDSKLISAKEDLQELSNAMYHLHADLETFDQKSKNSLLKCFDYSFHSEYYVNNVDAFQRYLDAKKEKRASCPAPSTE